MSDTMPDAGSAPEAAPVQAPPAEAARGPRGGGGVVVGAVLIALGAIFLVGQFVPSLGIDKLWPAILIVIGVAMMFRRR